MEDKVIAHLIYSEEYARRVIPFLRDDYFKDQGNKVLFDIILEHVNKYNKIPTKELVGMNLDNKELIEPIYNSAKESLSLISAENSDIEPLIDLTENWCKDRALYNAIMQAVKVYDGKDENLSRNSLPQLMNDALAVSFDTTIGHDYIDNSEERYEFYHEKKHRIPFDIDLLNSITGGGVTPKSLNLWLGGTGTGKSMYLCHLAASYITQGKNVLYVTLEMSEEEVAQRIDANLMGIPITDIPLMPKEVFEKKINRIRKNNPGKLVIKEYPTSSANANHFRHLINELKLKKKFDVDVLIIDYLNICSSARFKAGAIHNSYTIVKAIAEEIRGLAIEFKVPIWSASQTNRSGFSNSDVELTEISESFGMAHTADLILALIATEELDELGQMMVKQLKNRYNSLSDNRRFVIGVDRAQMRLYNVEQSAQDDVMDDTPAFDKTKFGNSDEERTSRKAKLKSLMV